jgi:hypothetical protein
MGEKNKHVDNHAIWIDRDNTQHMLMGCDGGLYETWDAAASWDYKANLPITQFYRVTVDNALPFYNIYGGNQRSLFFFIIRPECGHSSGSCWWDRRNNANSQQRIAWQRDIRTTGRSPRHHRQRADERWNDVDKCGGRDAVADGPGDHGHYC